MSVAMSLARDEAVMLEKEREKRKAKEKSTFEGGSTRSALPERYDLIPKEALDALGRRLALGASIHGENNWRNGEEEFRRATINHLMKHLLDYIEAGNLNDSNTDAIICNAAFLCYFEARSPRRPASDPAGAVRHT